MFKRTGTENQPQVLTDSLFDHLNGKRSRTVFQRCYLAKVFCFVVLQKTNQEAGSFSPQANSSHLRKNNKHQTSLCTTCYIIDAQAKSMGFIMSILQAGTVVQ